MSVLPYLLAKEFKQIFRNPAILAIIIGMPLIQLLVLPLAANYEVKNINICVVDHDHSSISRRIIGSIQASKFFKLSGHVNAYRKAIHMVEQNEADLILEIPAGMERKLLREKQSKLLIAANAINGVKASLGVAYLTGILAKYNDKIETGVDIAVVNWYNPLQLYHLFMVPGILAFLVTMVTGFLSAMNIVKEKEMGTIEQVNVTPITKFEFLLGKLLPFWIIGNVVFALGLLVSFGVYGIISAGSIFLLFAFLWIYLLGILGFGLLVSTYCQTQQQAMLIMFFFMLVFILMGGLLTPIEGMPPWARVIAALNPVTYFIEVVRMVVLKGSGLTDILPQFAAICVFAVVLNVWAVFNYRKVSG